MGRPRREARDEIVQAARARFFRQGIRRVTMEGLARDLKTSKATIYREFPSKELLVAEVMRQLNAEIDGRLGAVISSDDTFAEKLRRVTDFTAALLSEIDGRFLGDLATETPDAWREYQNRRRRRVEELYGALFEQGRRSGLIRRDIPLRILVEIYLKLTQLTVDSASLEEANATSREMYLAVGELFLHGARGPSETPGARYDPGADSDRAAACRERRSIRSLREIEQDDRRSI